MAETKFPVKLIHPFHPRNNDPDPSKVKTLTANSQFELDRLLAIGWKLKEPQA